jgi:hypothetical protein
MKDDETLSSSSSSSSPLASLQDDAFEAWPSTFLRSSLSHVPRTPTRTRCVLLTTGAMSPVHKGHVAMLTHAKQHLEHHCGFAVLAGYISPSHDLYVGPKMRSRGMPHVQAEGRVAMCTLAVQHHSWLAVGTWETRQRGHWPDYPEVVSALFNHIHSLEGADDVTVIYVCGTDHARYCGRGFGVPGQGVIVIPRAGEKPHVSNPERLVFGAGKASSAEVDQLSSTAVRQVCEKGH